MPQTDEERRQFALQCATKIAAEQQVDSYDGQTIANMAKLFYEFLRGDADTKTDHEEG